jgi:hypothetical protein
LSAPSRREFIVMDVPTGKRIAELRRAIEGIQELKRSIATASFTGPNLTSHLLKVAHGTTERAPPSQTPPCRFPAAGSSSRTLSVRPGGSNLRRQQRVCEPRCRGVESS